MEELLRELVHLGLSEKEAAVYVASLEIGPSSVQEIARRARVNRATTYLAIESLISRGLMSSHISDKRRVFISEAPDRLRLILRTRRQELDEKEREFEQVLPILLALYNAEGSKPQVRYLEGYEGLKTVRSIFERLPGEFVQIIPEADVQVLSDVQDGHRERLCGAGVAGRVIMVSAPDSAPLPLLPPSIQVRRFSAAEFPIHAEVTVRGNHTFLFSYKTSILALVIVSREIADSLRALFELAWKGSEKNG